MAHIVISRRTLLVCTALALCLGASGTLARQSRPTVSVAGPADQVAAETTRLNEWLEARYAEQLAFSPIAETFQGIKDQYAEIDDMSEAAQVAQLAWQRQSVEALKRDFSYDRLTPLAKLSYDLWVSRTSRRHWSPRARRR
jgi:hypothetical protein